MQKLVNGIFEMVSRMSAYFSKTNDIYWKHENQKDTMEWVARQLKHFGLNTRPMGISWGVLVEDEKK